MGFFDRLQRKILYYGGPFDGAEAPLLYPASLPWPEWVCRTQAGRSVSYHYEKLATHSPLDRTRRSGYYVYVGECVEVHHGANPSWILDEGKP